ncbi:MAG: hypothetical protein IK108_00015 [Clostridia bacterium]|nr:hypothetical protein [Clostridia bacterium]
MEQFGVGYDLNLLKYDPRASEAVRYDVERGYTFLRLKKRKEAKDVFLQMSHQHPGIYSGWIGLAAELTNNFTPCNRFSDEKIISEASEYFETAKKVAPENVISMIDAFRSSYESCCEDVFAKDAFRSFKAMHEKICDLKAPLETIQKDNQACFEEYEVYQIAQALRGEESFLSRFCGLKNLDFPVLQTFWYRIAEAFAEKAHLYCDLNNAAAKEQHEWYKYVYENSMGEAHVYWVSHDDPTFTEAEKYENLVKAKLHTHPEKTDYQIISWRLPEPPVITIPDLKEAEIPAAFSEDETELLRCVAEMSAVMRLTLDEPLLKMLPEDIRESYLHIQAQAAAADARYMKEKEAFRQEAEKQEKKEVKKNSVKLAIVALVVLAILGAFFSVVYKNIIVPNWVKPAKDYKEAVSLMDAGNYAQASKIFSSLSLREMHPFTNTKPYRDSLELVKRCKERALKNASVGDSVFMGNYYGETSYIDDPVEWKVLDRQDGKLLLITRYAYDLGFFKGNVWKNCKLRNSLEERFYFSCFEDYEKPWICMTENSTTPNPLSNTNSGDSTQDHIFILSYYEAFDYFPDNASRVAHTATDPVTPVPWWLRTIGMDSSLVCCVYTNGAVDCGEQGNVYPEKIYTRPVMWVSVP